MQQTQRELEYQYIRRSLRILEEPGEYLPRKVAQAVQQELTPRQRQMVELYYRRQMTMAEIAAYLGVNVSTVSRTIARGKRRLRRGLRVSGVRLLE